MEIIKSHHTTLTLEVGQWRIQLLPMTDAHLPLLYEWNQRTNVLYWCEGDDIAVNAPGDVDSIYGSISKKAVMFIIAVNDLPVGECWLQEMNLPGLVKKHPQKNVRRIDMTIYEEAYWGRGLGAAINAMLLRYAFENSKTDLIYAITEDYNIRAQKCLVKSGFSLDEVLEHEETTKGKQEYCYVISREKYCGLHGNGSRAGTQPRD